MPDLPISNAPQPTPAACLEHPEVAREEDDGDVAVAVRSECGVHAAGSCESVVDLFDQLTENARAVHGETTIFDRIGQMTLF
jgi:hypothetical protein